MAQAGDLDHIRGLEEQLFDRTVRRSPDAVDALLSDDFLEFARSGRVYRKQEVLRSLSADGGEPSELTGYGYELRSLAADVVLLTYRTVKVREGAAELHSLRSSIWRLLDGRWTMVFRQGTPAIPEFPPSAIASSVGRPGQ